MKMKNVIWRVYRKDMPKLEAYYYTRARAREEQRLCNEVATDFGYKPLWRLEKVEMTWLRWVWFYLSFRMVCN